MKALMIVSLLTFGFANAALAKPYTGNQYPGYPGWASQAFEPAN